MPQKTLNDFAREHQAEKGYPPLIVGREYLRNDLKVKLLNIDRHAFVDVLLGGELVGVKAKSLTWIDEPEVEATTPGLAVDLGIYEAEQPANGKRPTPGEIAANMGGDGFAAVHLQDTGYLPLIIGLQYAWGPPNDEQTVTLLDDSREAGPTRSKGFVSVRFPGGSEGAVAVESLRWIPLDSRGVMSAFKAAAEIEAKTLLNAAYSDARAVNPDHSEARALNHVIRAMHDGLCPKCHKLATSDGMRRAYANTEFNPPDATASWYERQLGWMCPNCGFTIEPQEAQAALAESAHFMERNLEIFEQWRANRNTSGNAQDDSAEPGEVPPMGASQPPSS